VQPSGGHRTPSLFSSRRTIQARGEAPQEETGIAVANKGREGRGSLLKQPRTVSVEDKPAMPELESEAAGGVHSVRSLLRQRVPILDQAHSATHAKRRLPQRRKDRQALADPHREKRPPCFAEHWDQAGRYLRQQGLGKPRRGSNAESGMRVLRRLESNHDGIRSAEPRQDSMPI
jgi:hypothetical protein